MSSEEQILIKGCKRGVRSAQQLLYTQYKPILSNICMRYIRDNDEATDVLHDVFMKIFMKIGQYKGEGSFEGWLKRLTTNYCLTVLKKKNRYQMSSLEDVEIIEDVDVEEVYTREQLFTALNQIPLDFSIVFSMFFLDEYSHEEIAKQLKIKEQTCRTRLYRAKGLLKKALINQNHEN